MQDLYLKFDDQPSALDVLRPLGMTYMDEEGVEYLARGGPHYALWEVGAIPGVEGWHVNLRVLDASMDLSSLDAYRTYPNTPSCVWA